jgi:hypothetical protein
VRVIASDGFNTIYADSNPFSLAPRPPVAVIRTPRPGQQIMEGDWLEMAGGSLTSAGPDLGDFIWLLDGQTVAGQAIDYQANGGIGDHTLTLQVTYAGLTTETSLTYTVLPNYNHDGIPNSWKQANSLNPLDRSLAMADTDGDGLTNLQEYELGSNPIVADTDGDGVSDSQELAAGTSPTDPAQTPPSAATLLVGAAELGFSLRIGDPAPAPYTVTVSNAGPGPLSWTAQAGQSWLTVTPSGNTPGALVVSADPAGLAPGVYTTQVTVVASGAVGSPMTLPVRLEVYTRAGVLVQRLYLPLQRR